MTMLHVIADNPTLTEELKTVLLKHLAPTEKFPPGTDDTILGQYLRAHNTGIKAVEDAFREIAQHKTTSTTSTDKNPAR